MKRLLNTPACPPLHGRLIPKDVLKVWIRSQVLVMFTEIQVIEGDKFTVCRRGATFIQRLQPVQSEIIILTAMMKKFCPVLIKLQLLQRLSSDLIPLGGY